MLVCVWVFGWMDGWIDEALRVSPIKDTHTHTHTGFERWHNNARFQAWVRREFLLRAAEEQQARRQQEGSFLSTGPLLGVLRWPLQIDIR